jgi:hypothetical protein
MLVSSSSGGSREFKYQVTDKGQTSTTGTSQRERTRNIYIPRCILNRDTEAVTEKMSQVIRRDRKDVTVNTPRQERCHTCSDSISNMTG